MLRNTLLTLCMAIPLTGCEVLMLGNVVVGCAIRPAPELLPNELPAAVVGVPYRIRIDVINASTLMSQLLVAPGKPLPNGLELTHIEREKHGVIQGIPTKAGRYEVLVYGSTYGTQCAGQNIERLYRLDVSDNGHSTAANTN
jgi:hypothetical protein